MKINTAPVIRMIHKYAYGLLLCLIRWVNDFAGHVQELSDYQDSTHDDSLDLVAEGIFKTYSRVYGPLLSYVFKRAPASEQIKTPQVFRMSVKTWSRIYNQCTRDRLRENARSFCCFSDCKASIRLLSCLRAEGDPDSVDLLSIFCFSRLLVVYSFILFFTARFTGRCYSALINCGPSFDACNSVYLSPSNHFYFNTNIKDAV